MNAKWDNRFLRLAEEVSTWSRDPSSKIGSVIVRPDKTVASMGFNGFARGVSDLPSRYEDRDFKIATVIHSEENAILFARECLKGYTIYVHGLKPCAHCASMIIQSGITRVVTRPIVVPDRWKQNMDWAVHNFNMAGVVIDEVKDDSCAA